MNVLVLQCGGPTAVVNASLRGAIDQSQNHRSVKRLWGARRGLQGLMTGDWVDLTDYRDQGARRLELQSGAALGSGRTPLRHEDLPVVWQHLDERDIHALVIIGGNGSMAAAENLSKGAIEAGYPLQVIGIPKTIDNDIAGTDACPGYGSAARFIAQSVHDAGLDLSAMRDFDDVVLFEVMGRYSGWLGAASSLARWNENAAPHLILLPEVSLHEDGFVAAVASWHGRKGVCMVVVAEGARDRDGAFLAERYRKAERDGSGQRLLGFAGGAAPYLAQLLRERLGLRCRQIRPETIQRSSAALASEVDRVLARRVGEDAVKAALEGRSGIMIALERTGNGWRSLPISLDQIAGRERTLPPDFIDARNFNVTPRFTTYARPLIGDWSPGVIDLES
jgi:ATP-dependent phosphofructokinase / diphosphate-dependent phosphofructokinase